LTKKHAKGFAGLRINLGDNKMNKIWILVTIIVLIAISGCDSSSTDQQRVRKALQKNAVQSRFTKVDLGSMGELLIDNLDKRMWVRFANTSQVVEVKYSLNDVVVPAEANEGAAR